MGAYEFPSRHSPELEGSLSGAGDQQGAIGAKGEIGNRRRLAAERMDQWSTWDSPELYRFVSTGGGQDSTGGAKSDRGYPGGMAGEGAYGHTGLHVPEFDRTVLTRRGEGLPVWTESHGSD